MSQKRPGIGLGNDSIDDHVEAGEAFTRMGVLSKENDRHVGHDLL